MGLASKLNRVGPRGDGQNGALDVGSVKCSLHFEVWWLFGLISFFVNMDIFYSQSAHSNKELIFKRCLIHRDGLY